MAQIDDFGFFSSKRRRREWTRSSAASSVQPVFKRLGRLWRGFVSELNFYRLHVLFFTFTPLIFSAIFYASNGQTKIEFIDCLFICYSAMTVTGLASFNVSSATTWQQVIMLILISIGNIITVSVAMVWVRRHFFRKKFDAIVQRSARARKKMSDVEKAHIFARKRDKVRLKKALGLQKEQGEAEASPQGSSSPTSSNSTDRAAEAEALSALQQRQAKRQRQNHGRDDQSPPPRPLHSHFHVPWKKKGPVRKEMIVRIDEPAQLIGGPQRRPMERRSIEESPSGRRSISPQRPFERRPIEEDQTEPETIEEDSRRRSFLSPGGILNQPDLALDQRTESQQGPSLAKTTRFDTGLPSPRYDRRRGSDPTAAERDSRSRRGSEAGIPSLAPPATEDRFPRSQTVEFADPPRPSAAPEKGGPRDQQPGRAVTTGALPRTATNQSGLMRHRTLDRVSTTASGYQRGVALSKPSNNAKERGFGGFPTPLELAATGFSKAFPGARDRFLPQTATMTRTSTIASTRSFNRTQTDPGTKVAPYLSFDVTVSGNSVFHSLTEAQRDELGGVEYRALDLLAKIVPAYWIGVQLFFFVLVAPYIASSAFDEYYEAAFVTQEVNIPNRTWFWFFQIMSSFSNCGLSLLDASMTNLPSAYFLLIPQIILILVGNTGYPIFLRFWVWIFSLCVPKSSRIYETLRFILDHPRRCFVYLFPSSQTWYLLLILVVLNCTDWVSFEVLDIGNPQIDAIPVGQRIFDGLFQAVSVRNSGFQVVSLLTIAPALQFLYVVMMYISAYPIALSVRSTNVYEERSLGVYTKHGPDAIDEEMPTTSTAPGWGTYLAAHARRQLAFDIWWLALALWLICIIERAAIENTSTLSWFSIFSCLFELTSAYGTVGLSLGSPIDSYSLSGNFRKLSKLIMIVTMLRGRHRGLPVAIDRSILLPGELEEDDLIPEDEDFDEEMERYARAAETEAEVVDQEGKTGESKDINDPLGDETEERNGPDEKDEGMNGYAMRNLGRRSIDERVDKEAGEVGTGAKEEPKSGPKLSFLPPGSGSPPRNQSPERSPLPRQHTQDDAVSPSSPPQSVDQGQGESKGEGKGEESTLAALRASAEHHRAARAANGHGHNHFGDGLENLTPVAESPAGEETPPLPRSSGLGLQRTERIYGDDDDEEEEVDE